MIRVRNLTKYYGERKAVDAISFNIEEGEIVGFLGPNGAGKTTTIRILTCYMPASAGSATVSGFDVFSQSLDVRRVIGYLPESTPLYTDMRAREYLNFRGKLRGLDHAQRAGRIRKVTEQCWLGDFIDRPIRQLSKGMRQRVGLADALLHDPKVLVLDEPTVGLDPTQIRETRSLVRELSKHHTVLLCSHILPEVEATCQRTIIIAGGRIVASGSPEELKERIRGGSSVIAEVRGPGPEIAAAVGQVAGVKSVQHANYEGWVRLTIGTQRDKDPRDEIAKLVVQRGWPLREIKFESGSLEEYFVQITAQQQIRNANKPDADISALSGGSAQEAA